MGYKRIFEVRLWRIFYQKITNFLIPEEVEEVETKADVKQEKTAKSGKSSS